MNSINPFDKVIYKETYSDSGIEREIEFLDGYILKSVIDPRTLEVINRKEVPPHGNKKYRNNEWIHPTVDDGLVFSSLPELLDHYSINKTKYYRMIRKLKQDKL